ncbi:hypothetical protein HH214_16735 [Mucilaginibacter robiniae]|uniref:Uncharacterized protein n=1 Tax=Mucilaginibacter robiniae TaxID=2728022 RepID=A0A7L5E462_9SPHI|nr:hypothetical protein [Mucilaginibacter robiniae]QJD97398.1 hypothetical protein HH214_16735 [Mucilaginibacter robiniae]
MASKIDINDLSRKVMYGVEKALKKLVKESAANNKDLVIADESGNIKTVQAKELLQSVYQNNTAL